MPDSPGDAEEGDRLLHHAVLYPHNPHRHPVVGRLLDRPRGRPRQDLRGSAHRAHHHHAALGVKGAAAQSALHQGQQKLACSPLAPGCHSFFCSSFPFYSSSFSFSFSNSFSSSFSSSSSSFSSSSFSSLPSSPPSFSSSYSCFFD